MSIVAININTHNRKRETQRYKVYMTNILSLNHIDKEYVGTHYTLIISLSLRLRAVTPAADANGFLDGAWGECMLSAARYEAYGLLSLMQFLLVLLQHYHH